MDEIIRAVSKDGFIQISAVTTREITERARNIHKTLPVATAALGRTMAAASMIGHTLKGRGGLVNGTYFRRRAAWQYHRGIRQRRERARVCTKPARGYPEKI